MLWRMPSMTKRIERARLRLDRGQPIARMRHELRDHRIVVDRDLAAFEDAGVVAHGDAVGMAFRRRTISGETPGRRQEAAHRIFGIDAALDRPALQLHVRLRQRELFAGGDADHLLDEIDARDQFRHRMLDLQARVHFEEDRSCGPGRRRTPPCRPNRSSPPWRARRPARPSCGASPRRAAATALPRSPSGCGAGSSIRARRDR